MRANRILKCGGSKEIKSLVNETGGKQAPLGDGETNHRVFIDLYAGCGGLSLGLMGAGWQGLLAVEKDSIAFETLKHNLIDGATHQYAWPTWFPQEPTPISRFIGKYHLEVEKLKGKITLLAGGPPCQGFSMAGKRNKKDPRNQLFKKYVEIVKVTRPPLLLLENVRGIGIAHRKKSDQKRRGPGRPPLPFSQKIKRTLESNGYKVFPRLVKAVDFGVPQLRPRFIIIAIDENFLSSHQEFDPFAKLDEIRRTFLEERELSVDSPVSAEEALSDLQVQGRELIECIDSRGFRQISYDKPVTHYQKLLHGSMNGTAPNSLRLARHRPEIVKRFQGILDSCRRGVQLNHHDRERLGLKKKCTVPLDPKKPSHTLTTLPDDLLHYSEPRILNVREYARLQSFPDWYEFKGKYTTGGDRRVHECPRYTQVGNAVPPFLAECLGRLLNAVADQLAIPAQMLDFPEKRKCR